MNREIKFRAWDKISNVIKLPKQIDFEHKEVIFETDNELIATDWRTFDDIILMQHIGCNDKSDKKIYEGDIVRWDDCSDGEKWRVAVVEMLPDIQFRIIKIKCDFIQSAQEGKIFRFGNFIYTDTENHLEVIGNIYQNADMLTLEK